MILHSTYLAPQGLKTSLSMNASSLLSPSHIKARRDLWLRSAFRSEQREKIINTPCLLFLAPHVDSPTLLHAGESRAPRRTYTRCLAHDGSGSAALSCFWNTILGCPSVALTPSRPCGHPNVTPDIETP